MFYLLLIVAGALVFSFSTATGGGGAMLLVPFVSAFLPANAVAPVLNLGTLLGRPARLALFWKDIDWQIVKHYLPAALIGAIAGAGLFAALRAEWLQIIVAIFLISTLFQYRRERERSFSMRLVYFVPLGFFVTFFSTLIGATGAVLNPFYLNYGSVKESLVATKAANSFFVGLVQVSSYVFFDTLHGELWLYGAALGVGIAVGNYFGKILLDKMSIRQFRVWVVWTTAISGLVMLFQQKDVILNLFF